MKIHVYTSQNTVQNSLTVMNWKLGLLDLGYVKKVKWKC